MQFFHIECLRKSYVIAANLANYCPMHFGSFFRHVFFSEAAQKTYDEPIFCNHFNILMQLFVSKCKIKILRNNNLIRANYCTILGVYFAMFFSWAAQKLMMNPFSVIIFIFK